MGRGVAKELQDASTALSNPGLTQQSWTHALILDSRSNPGLAQQFWTHAAILDSRSNPGHTQQSWTHAAILDPRSNPGLAQQSWNRLVTEGGGSSFLLIFLIKLQCEKSFRFIVLFYRFTHFFRAEFVCRQAAEK